MNHCPERAPDWGLPPPLALLKAYLGMYLLMGQRLKQPRAANSKARTGGAGPGRAERGMMVKLQRGTVQPRG